MIPTRWPAVLALAAALCLMATPQAVAAASLPEARELYASAAYGDALAMLDGLLRATPPREERQAIELYRVLCLVALRKRDDADRAVEGMIQRNPFYQPASDEIPPKMRAVFAEARKRLLPAVVQQDYAAAKGAFDRKDFGTAARAFDHVLKVLAQPDLTQAASRPPLSDVRTLAEGFRDLSAKAIAPPALEMPVPGRIYSAANTRVVPPIAIKQQLPRFRGRAAEPGEGMLEVVIDTTGAVESAQMTTPLDRQYDSQVIGAAKGWQYRPATFNGVPVKFRKQVRVTLVVTSR
jgi:TonB family protein